MSMFYCDYHQRPEDMEYVGFNETSKPDHFVCDDAVTALEDEKEFGVDPIGFWTIRNTDTGIRG